MGAGTVRLQKPVRQRLTAQVWALPSVDARTLYRLQIVAAMCRTPPSNWTGSSLELK